MYTVYERLLTSKVTPYNYDRDTSSKFPLKKKARYFFVLSHKQQGKKTTRHKFSERYCVL